MGCRQVGAQAGASLGIRASADWLSQLFSRAERMRSAPRVTADKTQDSRDTCLKAFLLKASASSHRDLPVLRTLKEYTSLYDAICSCHLLMYMICHQINYLPSTLSLKSSNKEQIDARCFL